MFFPTAYCLSQLWSLHTFSARVDDKATRLSSMTSYTRATPMLSGRFSKNLSGSKWLRKRSSTTKLTIRSFIGSSTWNLQKCHSLPCFPCSRAQLTEMKTPYLTASSSHPDNSQDIQYSDYWTIEQSNPWKVLCQFACSHPSPKPGSTSNIHLESMRFFSTEEMFTYVLPKVKHKTKFLQSLHNH